MTLAEISCMIRAAIRAARKECNVVGRAAT